MNVVILPECYSIFHKCILDVIVCFFNVLIMSYFHSFFLQESVSGAASMDDTIEKLGALVCQLPYSNYKTCGVLMYHLQR